MASEKDKVLSNLRACISSRGGLRATEVNNDYKCMVGEDLPFQRLGYSTLESFLAAVPDVNIFQKGHGEWWVEGKCFASGHIQKLVQGENKSKPARITTMKKRTNAVTNEPKAESTSEYSSSGEWGPPGRPHPKKRGQPPLRSLEERRRADTESSDEEFSATVRTTLDPSTQSSRKMMPINARCTPDLYRSDFEFLDAPLLPRMTLEECLKEMSLRAHQNSWSSDTVSFTSDETSWEPTSPLPPFFRPISYDNQNEKPSSDDSARPTIRRSDTFLPEYAYDDSSYLIKLTRYAEAQNWPQPEFFALARPVKHDRSHIGHEVNITCAVFGSRTKRSKGRCWEIASSYGFFSHPGEFDDTNLALDSVAKKAYKALMQKTAAKLPETEEHTIIFERISEIVIGIPQGVWLFQLEREYTDNFNEVLPSNLPDLLRRNCPNLEVNILYGMHYIIRPKAEMLPHLPDKVYERLFIGNVSLRYDDPLEVFVTNIKSLNELYVLQFKSKDFSVFEEMCDQMDDCYKDTFPDLSECIQLGGYYACISNFLNTRPRRCLVTGLVGNKYQVYLIDEGNVELVEAFSLRKLLPRFYEVPAQAHHCYLETLDNFDFALSNSPGLQEQIMDLLLANPFVARVVGSHESQRIFLSAYDGIRINQQVKGLALGSFTDPKVIFQKNDFLRAINVSRIDSLGRVFVQSPSWTLDFLNDKFSLISKGDFEVRRVEVHNISFNELYCANGRPTRVQVLDVLGDVMVGFVLVADCVDTGGVIEIELTELFEVPQLEDVFPHIPPQAIQVLLHDIPCGTLTPAQAEVCYEVINSTELPVIAKVISHIEEMPVVELFVRNEKNGLLMSLNRIVKLMGKEYAAGTVDHGASGDHDVFPIACVAADDSGDDSSSSTRPRTSSGGFSDSSIGPLSSIPSESEVVFDQESLEIKLYDELDVYISSAASPQNFTVIPVKYLSRLNDLEDDMTAYYRESAPSASYTPRLKECVAALHNESWIRVQIEKRVDSDCFIGRFLDKGRMDVFATKSLRVLDDRFKVLPYLAFTAQIHGVKPIDGKDWTVDDCIRLKSLIGGKNLASVVRGIISEGEGKKLSLDLVDTTTEFDVYISSQLLSENRALLEYKV